MGERVRAAAPLAVVIGVLAFLWVEVSLNFTFHWVVDGDLGNGLELPSNFHLIAPAAFVSWGFFFAAGADMGGLKKVSIATVIGTVGGWLLMVVSPKFAELPDFWGIALTVGILALLIVLASAAGDWFYTPAVFGAFAATVFWWTATGLDGWAVDGGGVGNSVKALGDPATAGAGAFGGVISTPANMVFVDSLVTMLIGCLLGLVSVKVAGMMAPKPAPTDSPRPQPQHA